MEVGYNRISLLGVKADVFTEKEFLDAVIEVSCLEKRAIIGNHNLHSIHICHKNVSMQEFYRKARFIHIDGMPIIWAGKLLNYKLTRDNRHASLDWILKFFRLCAEKNLNVFLLGSQPGVAEKAALVFRKEAPGLKVAWHHGYFDKGMDSQENLAVIQAITDFNTNVLLVGMGMPLQENWISDNIQRMEINVALALGAFMDFYAGVKPMPPRWMGRLGLEWLSRLYSEPKRLWRRYLIEPWFILGIFLPELLERRFRRR